MMLIFAKHFFKAVFPLVTFGIAICSCFFCMNKYPSGRLIQFDRSEIIRDIFRKTARLSFHNASHELQTNKKKSSHKKL